MSHARPLRKLPALAAAFAAALVPVSCQVAGDADHAPQVDELTPLAYTEEVRVGSLDDPELGFSRIRGVERADDGTVYVLESQVPEIRVYDRQGRRLRTVGGPGEGPGEFAFPSAFGLVGDTLWVNDPGNQRISWFGPDGSLVHETPVTPLPVETDVPGMSLSVAPGALRPDGLLGSQHTRMMGGGAADRPFSFPVVRFDRDGRVVDTLRWDTVHVGPTVRVGGRALHPPSLRPRNPLVVEEEGGGRVELDWGVPASGGEGVLEVVRVTADGDTPGRSALRYELVPLPGAVRDSLLDRPEGMGRRYGVSDAELEAAMASGLELPDHRPPLRSARAGRDGSLWIELNGESTDSAAWVVLDPELTPRGRVTLPIGMNLRLIDGSTVWAVETDELDVPWLVRLRVE